MSIHQIARAIRSILACVGLIFGFESTSAHNGFENETEARIFADRMEVCVRTTSGFAWKILGERAPAAMDEAGQTAALPYLTNDAPGLFDVSAAGSLMMPTGVDCRFEPDGHVAFLLTYDRPPGWPLVFKARFFESFDPLSSGTIKVFDQTTSPYKRDIEPLTGKVLSRADPSLSVSLGAGAPRPAERADVVTAAVESSPPGFSGYFLPGIGHIVSGYDHLLFLLALLLGCRSLRQICVIVIAFTLAHSITLALAAVGVMSVPVRWVEAFVALSIVFVGVENITAKVASRRRVGLAFAFGLVHGLAFAGALKKIGLGAGGQSILPPLLAFNLGVEAGQLGMVLVTLPVLLHLRKQERFCRYGIPALSWLVIVAGVLWFLQRLESGPVASALRHIWTITGAV